MLSVSLINRVASGPETMDGTRIASGGREKWTHESKGQNAQV